MPKDTDENEGNKSVGYWRRNSLMALRENREFERDAANPEHLAAIQADNAEIAQLEARETAVKTRHASMVASQREREQANRNIKAKGFTLIELSIVLVIIGLVVGGVLTGQDLIKAATLRAQITQIQNYTTAVTTFKLKYDALPGDLTPTTATQFGFTTRTGAAYHGDGNGQVLHGCGAGELGCENALFWVDLSTASLINGNFNTATDALVTAAAGTIGSYLPEGKLKGNFIEVRYDTSYTYTTLNSNNFMLVGDTSFAAGARTSSLRIPPQDAMNIDLKMDDGKPYTGSVTTDAAGSPSAPAAGVCISNASGYPYNTSTATYANTNACSYMFFKF